MEAEISIGCISILICQFIVLALSPFPKTIKERGVKGDMLLFSLLNFTVIFLINYVLMQDYFQQFFVGLTLKESFELSIFIAALTICVTIPLKLVQLGKLKLRDNRYLFVAACSEFIYVSMMAVTVLIVTYIDAKMPTLGNIVHALSLLLNLFVFVFVETYIRKFVFDKIRRCNEYSGPIAEKYEILKNEKERIHAEAKSQVISQRSIYLQPTYVQSEKMVIFEDGKCIEKDADTVSVKNSQKYEVLIKTLSSLVESNIPVQYRIPEKINGTKNEQMPSVEYIRPQYHNDLRIYFSQAEINYENEHLRYLDRLATAIQGRLNCYQQQLLAIIAGNTGEENVYAALKNNKSFLLLKNLRLNGEENGHQASAECDVVVIAPQGLFVLETKNLGVSGTYSVEIETTGRWRKIYEGWTGAKYEDYDYNPTEQNNRQVAFINNILNTGDTKVFNKFIPCIGFVVIANEKIDIVNKSVNQKVYRINEVVSYILSQPVIFSEEQMKKIEQVLLANSLEEKSYVFDCYNKEIIDFHNALVLQIQTLEKNMEMYTDYAIKQQNVIDSRMIHIREMEAEQVAYYKKYFK